MARLFKIIGSLKNGHEKSAFVFVFIYLPHDYNNYKKIPKKKCWKKWRGGLKETIVIILELMLIRPPQLQFFEDATKITATDMLWFSFFFGLNFIFLCLKLIIMHYHTPKQRKIKFKPRKKLNHNRYKIISGGKLN